jgi:hypothetical protein
MSSAPATGKRTGHRRVVAAVMAAAAVLLVSGCSLDRLGAAAVVEGGKIPTERVQELAQEHLRAVGGGDSQQVQRSILQQLVVSRVFDEIARERGLRVSEGRIAESLDAIVQQVGSRRGVVQALAQQQQQVLAPSQLQRWMRDQLLFEALARDLASGEPDQEAFDRANQVLTQHARGMDIEINPRYGRWNAERGIAPLVGGGLSQTVEQLTGKS